MRWVVLSDLHMDFNNCTTEIARNKLIEKLKCENDSDNISFVIITGDCFHRNKGDVKEIELFISRIAKACKISKKRIILCPGNHDVSRKISDRNIKIQDYRNGGNLPEITDCLSAYGSFEQLYALVKGQKYSPFSVQTINDINVISVDSCLLCMDENDYGHINVNFKELNNLSKKIKKDDKFNIVVMHHGVEWMQPYEGRRFQHWLADNKVRLVICGHNHAPGMNVLTEAIEPNGIPISGIQQFTCGCAIHDNYSKPVFFIGEMTENKFVKMKLYEYRDDSNWKIASGNLRDFPDGVYNESNLEGLINNSYDIPYYYKTIFDIDDIVAEEIKTSTFLNFFGLRGRTFLKDNSKIASSLYDKENEIRFRGLVSDPYSIYIEKRLRSVPKFAPQSKLEEQWKINYIDIKKLRDTFPKNSTWRLRFHEQPLLFRFIQTDYNVYIGYYAKEPSSKSPMLRYSNKSAIYQNLKNFFEAGWENGKTNFSPTIPDRCSFILDKFDMKPSLVINLDSLCNMDCKYCPEGGENLKKCDDLCGIEQIKYLLTAYSNYYKEKKWTEKKIVRITGGEPLLDSQRLLCLLQHAKNEGYEKIVLCTNGILLQECYEDNSEIWESVKSILLLKISLDSLRSDVFKEITRSKDLNIVINNILFAKRKNFKIELNFVATKLNVSEIRDVYDFAHELNLVGLKVLTVNDFGGRIESDDVEKELSNLISSLRNDNFVETGLYVHNNKGIYMKRFIKDGCTLTIVDHMNREKSVTPRRTYGEVCQTCDFYPDSYLVKSGNVKPCATGIMSMTMRADGVLSYCRMIDSKMNISGKNKSEIQIIVEAMLKNFDNCYHYEIEEKKNNDEKI